MGMTALEIRVVSAGQAPAHPGSGPDHPPASPGSSLGPTPGPTAQSCPGSSIETKTKN